MVLGELSEYERKAALTNVILMMIADGKITPEEERYLERVRRRVGASKAEVDEILAKAASLKIIPPVISREKVFQMIDMVAMMRADGEIDHHERELCVRFAREIGLGDKVIEKAVNRACSGLKEGRSRQEINENIVLTIDV